MIAPNAIASQCAVFENTNVQVLSLESHDHVNTIFDFLVKHQLADDIKYCMQQVLGDMILLISPSEKFSIPANVAIKTIDDFSSVFSSLFNQMCDINADIIFPENNAHDACLLMNKALNDWLLSFRAVYNKNTIPLLTPACFDINVANDAKLATSSDLAQMYKNAGTASMKMLITSYMNKYNALCAPTMQNMQNLLYQAFVAFATEALQGKLVFYPAETGFSIRNARYIPTNTGIPLNVLVRSFPKEAMDACEEIFRATFVY